jgi:hypothetical protein
MNRGLMPLMVTLAHSRYFKGRCDFLGCGFAYDRSWRQTLK